MGDGKRSAQHRAALGLQGLQDGLYIVVGLLGSEGAVVSPEDQVEGHGLFTLGHALAPVDVEQLDLLEQAVGPLLDGGLQGADGDLLAADHGDVAGHGGELGQGDVLGIGPLGGAQGVKGQLRAVELRVHTVVLSHQGMDLAEYAHLTAVHQDPAQRPGW